MIIGETSRWTPESVAILVTQVVALVVFLTKQLRAEGILKDQNRQLDRVETKVNGGMEKTINALKDQHKTAIQDLKDQHALELSTLDKTATAARHALNNQITALTFQRSELEKKLITAGMKLPEEENVNSK